MKDFKKYHFKDLPDGRCVVLEYDRDIEDLIKEFNEVKGDDLEGIEIFSNRVEAHKWVNQKVMALISKKK